MAQSGLYLYREQIFGKGYNDKLPPEFIPKGYLADALNCLITDDKITKRTGYSIIGNDTGDKKILGLCGIKTTGGVRRLYKFHNNSGDTAIEIYEWTGSGNWALINDTLLTNTDNDVNYVIAENVVYAYDGSSTPVKITPGSPSSVAAVTDVNHPKGKFGAWFHNFHFVVDNTNKNKLYWSDLGDSDDFTNGITGNADVNPDDGDQITGLHSFKDELIIFKENSIWSLSGFGTSTFTVADLTEYMTGIGTLSHRSVVNIGNDLLFLSFAGGIPEIRSLQRTRLGQIVDGGNKSDDIVNTMDGLNKAQLTQATTIYDGRRAYFAVPNASSTYNDLVLVYDQVNKGWVRWTGLNVSAWFQLDFSAIPTIYFSEASADSLVYKLDTSTSDNGTAINFQVKTRNYGGDRPEIKKRWKYLYTVAETEGDYDLTVNYSPDGFTFEELDAVDLSATTGTLPFTLDSDRLGSTDITRHRTDFAKKTTYYMQLQFAQSGLNQSAVIRDWELLYKLRGLRDA